MVLHPGATLGDRYQLIESVAHGGMGEVWRASDTVLDRTVAVKTLLPALADDTGFTTRFRAEARAMAALSDPGIVEIYDYGQSGGVAYLVMQYVEGEALNHLLHRVGPLRPAHAMSLVAQAAKALQAAHARGIVHRDVKPGNLLIRSSGRLVLTDFGVARMVAEDRVTDGAEVVGTAAYLAPEQVTGGPITAATDVYALGVVAYECLTGARPFEADTPAEVARMQAGDAPPPLPETIPTPVREVVLRALAKEPAERWPSAAAMADATVRAVAASAPAKAEAHAEATPAVFLPGSVPLASPPFPAPTLVSPPLVSSSQGPVPTPVGSAPAAFGSAPAPLESVPAAPLALVARARGRRPLALLAGLAALVLVAAGLMIALRPSSEGGVSPAGAVAGTPSSSPTSAPECSTGGAAPTGTAGDDNPGRGDDNGSGNSGSGNSGSGHSGSGHGGLGRPRVDRVADETRVPSVVGQSEQLACTLIIEAGLVPDVHFQTTAATCQVLEQSPEANEKVRPGSTVVITVARPIGACGD